MNEPLSDEGIREMRHMLKNYQPCDIDIMHDMIRDALNEIDRLRKWNAQLTQALDFHFEAANKYCDQLAKAVRRCDSMRKAHVTRPL